MQEKLTQLKQEARINIDDERTANLLDLSRKFESLEEKHVEFYGEKQLNYMMKSLVFEKELIKSDFDI